MHTKCLGTDSNLVGSCLAYMAKELLPGTITDNVAAMWQDISSYYKANNTPCRLSHLTVKMIKNDPFHRLAAKAIEIRWLLPAVETILRPWTARDASVAWMHRLVVLSCRMDAIVFQNKSFLLTADERVALKGFIFEYNQCLTQLGRHFHSRGQPYFNYTPKNHFLCHMGVDASKSGISPRLGWCFQGEDFMRLVKTLSVASNRGVDPGNLVNKVVEKYLRGLDLLLKHL